MTMKNLFINKLIIASAALAFTGFLTACSDDDSSTQLVKPALGPDGSEIPDSVFASDSLYNWYLESLAKEIPEQGDKPKSSSSSGKDGKSSSSDEDNSSSSVDIDTLDYTEYQKIHLLPPAGFYSNPLTIPVSLPTKGGIIRCTLNGSEPTPESAPFTEPLTIVHNTVVRCAEFVNDTIARKSSHTFFIDEVVTMPVVAISVDSVFFRESYANTADCYGQMPEYCSAPIMREAEYPVHVEFFEKGSASDKKTWQIDAGISLMGNASRTYAKKPVTIKMKKIYEDGRLKYSLFSTRPEDNKFKGFNLRNGGNRYVGDFVADPAMTSVVEGSGVDYQRSRQVVVFYNGVYMGIHDLRERINEHFVETNHGIDSKSVDVVKHVKDVVTASGGTADAYNSMLDFIGNNDLTTAENYKTVQTMMDVGNYAHYMATQIYLRNGDWPSNNVRAWRSPEQPFRFILFDVDQGFNWEWSALWRAGPVSMFDWIRDDRESGRTAPGFFANIFIKLRENPDFCRMFVNHAAVMLSTYLTYERMVAAVERVNSEITQAEMDRDLNNEPVFQRRYSPYGESPATFDRTGAYVVSYAKTRTQGTREEYRTEFNLGKDISVTISASGNGSILLDGMKLPSTNYTGTFFAGNDMLLEAVPAEGRVFNGWSDGNMENPRLVSPKDGDEFVAKFK